MLDVGEFMMKSPGGASDASSSSSIPLGGRNRLKYPMLNSRVVTFVLAVAQHTMAYICHNIAVSRNDNIVQDQWRGH